MGEMSMSRSDAGLGALLDLGFERFITLSVIKVVYILGMAVIGLVYLGMIIASFTQGVMAAIGAIIVGALVAVLYLIFFRIWLELIVVMFRIGENTSKLVQQAGGTPAGSETSSELGAVGGDG